MQIFVDDRPYSSVGPSGQTVAQLATEVLQAAGGQPERLVVAVRCNGEPVSDPDLDAVLNSRADRYERLELQTQPMTALVQATLSQAIELFQDNADNRHRIADLLDEGRQQEAMEHLQKFFEVWRQVQESMLVCARALGIDLDRHAVNGLGVAQIVELIRIRLQGLKEAMVNADHVIVGDILRYEFDEPFRHWLALLASLREETRKTRT